jgi:hypothetical protein
MIGDAVIVPDSRIRVKIAGLELGPEGKEKKGKGKKK